MAKGRALRPPTRDEYDALADRLAMVEARADLADRALSSLDQPIKDAALARLG